MKRNFVLEGSSIYEFVLLLETLTSDVGSRQFPAQSGWGYYVLEKVHRPSSVSARLASLEMKGSFHSPESNGVPVEDWLIRFAATSFSDEHVAVIAECQNLALEDYLRELVEDIKRHVRVMDLTLDTPESITIPDTESDAGETDRTELRRILVNRFDETELRELFFDLGIEYDSLSGEGTRDKAMELIGYCERRERIGELVEKGKQLRPDISWADQKSEQKAATEKLTEDGRITTDERRNQTTLDTYFDRMTELLLEKGLRESKEGDEVRSIARTRTLAVLRSLDGNRKGQVVQFLYESGLIGPKTTIVSLSGADLGGVDLYKASLSGADLSKANLSGADLRRAFLSGANLSGANLGGADMTWINLNRANLAKATLSEANLTKATLSETNLNRAILREIPLPDGTIIRGADLTQVDLSWADLTRAEVTDEQLAQAWWLTGTTLPDGTKHD